MLTKQHKEYVMLLVLSSTTRLLEGEPNGGGSGSCNLWVLVPGAFPPRNLLDESQDLPNTYRIAPIALLALASDGLVLLSTGVDGGLGALNWLFADVRYMHTVPLFRETTMTGFGGCRPPIAAFIRTQSTDQYGNGQKFGWTESSRAGVMLIAEEGGSVLDDRIGLAVRKLSLLNKHLLLPMVINMPSPARRAPPDPTGVLMSITNRSGRLQLREFLVGGMVQLGLASTC